MKACRVLCILFIELALLFLTLHILIVHMSTKGCQVHFTLSACVHLQQKYAIKNNVQVLEVKVVIIVLFTEVLGR